MENIEELRREAEEAKEKIRRDIIEFRDILRRLAEHAGANGRTRAEAAMHKAEKGIEDTAYRVESRIEKALAAITGATADAGKPVTQERDFTDFTNVEIDCCFNVEIVHAEGYSVSLTAGEQLFDYLDIAKSGNTLRISVKPLPFRSRPDLKVRITMPFLRKLRLGAAARCTVRGFSSDNGLDIALSGSSSLDAEIESGRARVEISGASRVRGKVKLGDAEFVLSGASQAQLSGSADNAALSAWGASRLDLVDFALKDTTVQLKGASQAAVRVEGRLGVDLSGGSRLTYSGDLTMGEVNVSGASTLTQRQ